MPTPYRSVHTLQAIRDLVYDNAREQGGAFRRSDLRRWGTDDAVLLPMIRRRWWIRLHHGVYADARSLIDDPDSPAGHLVRCAASIRALQEPAYAFGSSAGMLHELPMQQGLLAQVQLIRPLDLDGRALRRRVTARQALAPAKIRAHRLGPADTDLRHGVPTVSRDLAAVSTAAMSSPDWAVATLDAAAWQDAAVITRLDSLAVEWSHLSGIGTVRRSLPTVRTGAQTPLETFSRLRLLRQGLPEPRLQVPVYDDAGLIGYVDMLWDDLGVVGEADGLVKYDSRDVVIREKEREDRIRARGYPVVRWTWRELFAAPDDVARRIVAASRSWRRTG